MVEAVRLLVWDLDETFWRGTLTEGGITEYVTAHHDLVIALARRGIMSSICSKNDPDQVRELLVHHGIADYFIFPSVSWEPKGVRLAALIEAVQLRAQTVMFIDDNANNRAEAAALILGLQVEDEAFISRIADDKRFKGRGDPALKRLAQYKVLESKSRALAETKGGNEAFLRGCDVRVFVEHDVVAHLDRAIELINRTNQLNFTKWRLPEDPDAARAALTTQIGRAGTHAGLIHVVDKYGDYGFVGFFLMAPGRKHLVPGQSTDRLMHFCFSCRTLGMLVEAWVFEKLRRPELTVAGDVLTDLSVTRTIDWIREVPSLDAADAAQPRVAPQIRIHGGCEATSVAHYLAPYAPRMDVSGNFSAGAMFVRVNSAALLLSARDTDSAAWEQDLATLGVPAPLLGGQYFDAAPEGTLFVFSGGYDAEAGHPRYRHRAHGGTIRIEVNGHGAMNLVEVTTDQVAGLLARPHFQSVRDELLTLLRTIQAEYEVVTGPTGPDFFAMMRRFLHLVPAGCRIVFMLDDERVRWGDGTLKNAPWVAKYNEAMLAVVAEVPYAATARFGDCILQEEEIHVGGNHYARAVYARMADLIVRVSATVPAKSAEATDSHSVLQRA